MQIIRPAALRIASVRVAVALVAALGATTARADNWKQVAESSSGSFQALVDVDSLAREAQRGRARVMQNFREARAQDPGKSVFQSSVSLMYFDCGERTQAYVQTKNYAGAMAAGSVVSEDARQPDELEFEPVPPESVAAEVLGFVCAMQPL